MKTIVWVIALMLLPLTLLTVDTQAQQCSTRQLSGKYVIACGGYLPKPGYPDAVPSKLLGTFRVDPAGNVSVTSTLNVRGESLLATYEGPVLVNPDCTATATLRQWINGVEIFPLNLTLVVSDHGNIVDMLETDSGAVFSCKATRMSQ